MNNLSSREKHSWTQINVWKETDDELEQLKEDLNLKSRGAVINVLLESYNKINDRGA